MSLDGVAIFVWVALGVTSTILGLVVRTYLWPSVVCLRRSWIWLCSRPYERPEQKRRQQDLESILQETYKSDREKGLSPSEIAVHLAIDLVRGAPGDLVELVLASSCSTTVRLGLFTYAFICGLVTVALLRSKPQPPNEAAWITIAVFSLLYGLSCMLLMLLSDYFISLIIAHFKANNIFRFVGFAIIVVETILFATIARSEFVASYLINFVWCQFGGQLSTSVHYTALVAFSGAVLLGSNRLVRNLKSL